MEILGTSFTTRDKLALGIPIVVLGRCLVGVGARHPAVDLSLIRRRSQTGIGPLLDVAADLLVGFRFCLESSRISC